MFGSRNGFSAVRHICNAASVGRLMVRAVDKSTTIRRDSEGSTRNGSAKGLAHSNRQHFFSMKPGFFGANPQRNTDGTSIAVQSDRDCVFSALED
jgi:hypothetical protein